MDCKASNSRVIRLDSGDDRWYNRNCTICLQVIVLFVFDSQKSPLGTTETFCESTECKHHIQFVEGCRLASEVIQEKQPYESQYEVAKDGPVIEEWMIVDLRTKESILVTFLIAAEEAPIHVNIPNKTVDSFNHGSRKIQPEPEICLIFDTCSYVQSFMKTKC